MANATTAPISSLQVGDVKLTWLPDGVHHVRALQQYANGSPEVWEVHAQYIDDDDWLVMSVGGLLVQSADRTALVDLGFGPRAVHDISVMSGGAHQGDLIGGEMMDSLAQVGLKPEDVTDVVLTHLHPDHIGWAGTEQGDGTWAPTFDKATYHVGDVEWEFWTEGPVAGMPGAPTATEVEVMRSRLNLLQGSQTVLPGLTAMPTPGHTPGHLSFVVSSGKERAVILGDAVHCPAEIAQPELDFVFDVDPQLARQAKEQIAKELEQGQTHAVGGHFANAIFGRLLPGESRQLSF